MNCWTEQYLNYLGLEKKEPSYVYLLGLIEAHLQRVPFEVISKYHYYTSKNRHDLKIGRAHV